jgi:glycerol-3-phosphate acyltransferase PlsY
MDLIDVIAAILAGYWLGALPFAVIVAKRLGVDIFKKGSGNPGATNVTRVCGKGPGNLVFFLDFLKGFIAATWVRLDFIGTDPSHQALLSVLGLGAACNRSFIFDLYKISRRQRGCHNRRRNFWHYAHRNARRD